MLFSNESRTGHGCKEDAASACGDGLDPMDTGDAGDHMSAGEGEKSFFRTGDAGDHNSGVFLDTGDASDLRYLLDRA